jgi:hypothetical protein
MTTIAAEPRLRVQFLPFDEEEWVQARPRRRGLPRSLAAWLLLPALLALVAVGIMYAAQTARATALIYQIAALRTANSQLVQTYQLQGEQLDQLQSAGAMAQAAGQLGMIPPPSWTVVTPPRTNSDPLAPVLVALRGG